MGSIFETMCRYYGVDDKTIKHIANAYRLLFHGKTSTFDAVNQIEEQVPDGPEIRNVIQFIRQTQLGVIGKK